MDKTEQINEKEVLQRFRKKAAEMGLHLDLDDRQLKNWVLNVALKDLLTKQQTRPH